MLVGALADIAVCLSDARPTELVAQDVLERAHLTISASELAVWLDAAGQLARTWGAGPEEASLDEVRAALAGAAPGIVAREMFFGPRRVGILLARFGIDAGEPAERFVEALAALLAAFVANSERSRRLESDLQIRMREVQLTTPVSEAAIGSLELGDVVYLTGVLYTAREGVYRKVVDEGVPLPAAVTAATNVNFHCSPAACAGTGKTWAKAHSRRAAMAKRTKRYMAGGRCEGACAVAGKEVFPHESKPPPWRGIARKIKSAVQCATEGANHRATTPVHGGCAGPRIARRNTNGTFNRFHRFS